jgi:DNA-binding IclR family transcriptional regulator
MAASSEPGRSTASRLFAVLFAFDRAHPTMTLTALASATGLPIATTYRLVRELVTAGALERNEDSSYQIGLRLWRQGALAPRQRDLRTIARPVMESLHEATRETVQLAVLESARVLCVEKVSGSRSATNITEVAGGLPLHASGVGKVILGFADPDALPDVGGRRLRRFTVHTNVDPEVLDQEVRRTRAEFVAYCREELTLGTCSVASPVFDAEGVFVAALGVLTGSRASLNRLAPAVRSSAMLISKRLGHRAVGQQARWVG